MNATSPLQELLGDGTGERQLNINDRLTRLTEQQELIIQRLDMMGESLVQIESTTETSLDRLELLKTQLSGATIKIRQEIRGIITRSRCNPIDPTTYANCIKLYYKLLYTLLYFSSQLIFLLGGYFSEFGLALIFPFTLIVIFGYIIQLALLFLLFDNGLFVATFSLSHRSGANLLLYDNVFKYSIRAVGLIVTRLFTFNFQYLQQTVGRFYRIANEELNISGRLSSAGNYLLDTKQSVIDNLKKEISNTILNEVNKGITNASYIPATLAKTAYDTTLTGASYVAEGISDVGSVALEKGSALGSVALEKGAALGSTLGSVALEKGSALGYGAIAMGSAMGSALYNKMTSKKKNRMNGGKSKTKKVTLKPISILNKKELVKYEKSEIGKRMKELKDYIENIDYTKERNNPKIYETLGYILKIMEEFSPKIISGLEESIKTCHKIRDNKLDYKEYNKEIIKVISSAVRL